MHPLSSSFSTRNPNTRALNQVLFTAFLRRYVSLQQPGAPSMAPQLSLLPISSPRSDSFSLPAPAARTAAACSAACHYRWPKVPSTRCSLHVRYAHDSIAAVLFLLLIVTASYAQAPWAPLVSYGLVGKCTQVARSPCCSSASVPTSSRAAQPTLVRSTSPCIYVCYTHSTIAPQARPPRSSSVLATHTSMCYMRTTCMCICRSCAERHACSSHMCGAALNCAVQP